MVGWPSIRIDDCLPVCVCSAGVPFSRCRTIHFPINQQNSKIITRPGRQSSTRKTVPGLSAGGPQRDTRTLSSFVLATKIMCKLKSVSVSPSLTNGKMKPNKLQTVCTFRGDPLVHDPRLELQNAGSTHSFTAGAVFFLVRYRTGHVFRVMILAGRVSKMARVRARTNGVSLLLTVCPRNTFSCQQVSFASPVFFLFSFFHCFCFTISVFSSE